ncbi:hypothetical protein DOY81_011595, partial [Sarcophaga bullata]
GKVYCNLNNYLKGHTYMVSNYFTIADIAAISSVSAFHIIFPIDYDQYPRLFNWYHCIKKMSFYQHNEEGIFKLRYLLEVVGKFPFPSPYRNGGKRRSVKSEDDQRSEGGCDDEHQQNDHSRKSHSNSPKRKEKFLAPSELSTTSSGKDIPAQKRVMSETILSPPVLEHKGSPNCKCKPADGNSRTNTRRKLYEDTLAEYCQRNYYMLPKNCEDCEYMDSQGFRSHCGYCPTVECIDYSGGLCNQPITYQVNNAVIDQRLAQDLRHKASSAANNSEGMAFCNYHNAHGMCWCNHTNQIQYCNNECTNPKLNTKDNEKKICESIIHVAVEKLKKQKKEQGKKCSKVSIASKSNYGENCSGTDTSCPTYVWYPKKSRIQKSAACCNLIREGCCAAENTRCVEQEVRNSLQASDQARRRCCSPSPDKWCGISQKSIEICDLPPNPQSNQAQKCKDCNCQQLQINCQYCRSNPDIRCCNQNYRESRIDGTSSCKTNTPIRQQSSQCYTESQCFENTMQTFPGCELTIQEHDNSNNMCATGKVKKFPVVKGSPIDGKTTRRFFILSPNNLNENEKDETSPATVTDLSEDNKKKRCKKTNPSAAIKKRPLNRLQAGSAREFKRKTKFKRTKRASQFTDDSVDTMTDDSEEVTKIIYHICMKDDMQKERRCKCSNCVKAEFRKSFKSKIPRLIRNYRNSGRNVARAASDYEVFGKNYF